MIEVGTVHGVSDRCKVCREIYWHVLPPHDCKGPPVYKDTQDAMESALKRALDTYDPNLPKTTFDNDEQKHDEDLVEAAIERPKPYEKLFEKEGESE